MISIARDRKGELVDGLQRGIRLARGHGHVPLVHVKVVASATTAEHVQEAIAYRLCGLHAWPPTYS